MKILRFAAFSRLAQYRDGVPPAACFAARIAAAMSEDCGPCAQLVVRMAAAAGVPAPTLRAIVAGDLAAREHFGERGVVALALAIANTRVFPTIKRALGYAHACSRIEVAGELVAPGAAQFAARHA